jgi:aerobic carbon-monoxide dehydrogenase medium subunit
MKPARFDYERPHTVDEALALLARRDAKAIAGGQSLGPMLNLRLAQPALLVDLRRVPELATVDSTPETVFIGACTTHASIEDGAVPDPANGLLRRIARGIAYRAVRNRGTIGGSLAHADPASDWVSAMALLDATVVVRGIAGERAIPASRLVTGVMTTALSAQELILGVRIPRLAASARWSYWKFCRKFGDFAEAIAGFILDPELGQARGIVGATAAAPLVISDPLPFIGRFDASRARTLVQSAGFEPGSYEHQVHLVALERAAAGLR